MIHIINKTHKKLNQNFNKNKNKIKRVIVNRYHIRVLCVILYMHYNGLLGILDAKTHLSLIV